MPKTRHTSVTTSRRERPVDVGRSAAPQERVRVRHRGAHSVGPRRAKPRGRLRKPQRSALRYVSHPHRAERIPPTDATVHSTLPRRLRGGARLGRAAGVRLRRLTRRVDQLVESLGLRASRSEVSRICAGLDEQQVEAFPQAAAAFYAFPADHWRKPIDESARAAQLRGRAAHRRRRHLPRRPFADPARHQPRH